MVNRDVEHVLKQEAGGGGDGGFARVLGPPSPVSASELLKYKGRSSFICVVSV